MSVAVPQARSKTAELSLMQRRILVLFAEIGRGPHAFSEILRPIDWSSCREVHDALNGLALRGLVDVGAEGYSLAADVAVSPRGYVGIVVGQERYFPARNGSRKAGGAA